MTPWDLPSRMASALLKLNAFEDKDVARFRTSLNAFDSTMEYAIVDHKSDLYYYQSQGNTVRQLTHDPDAPEKVPTLSPDGKYVAFVRDNNIWVVNCESTELRQMTKDGAAEILNGYLDWVYQEEVYGRGNFKAFWWSPDGRKIAFLRLDESPVPNFVINDSISFEQKIENIRYPKAGQRIPSYRFMSWMWSQAQSKKFLFRITQRMIDSSSESGGQKISPTKSSIKFKIAFNRGLMFGRMT